MESSAGDDAAWAEARRKADVVARTLPDAPPTVRVSVREAARVLGVARATVFRWRIRFEVDRRATSLLPRRRGRLQGTSQIDRKVDDFIDTQLRSYYLRPEGPSIRSLVERVRLRCDERGLPRPSWRAVKPRILRLDARTKLARQFY